MSYYEPATIGHCDQLGYTFCVDCVTDDDTIIMDVAANNCAFDETDCERCGTRLPFTRRTADFVRSVEVVRLAV